MSLVWEPSGVRVLDAGLQPPSDLHPKPSDPEPDPEFPLVMVMCLDCRLVQLESDSTTPEEPRGLEPRALVEQAEAAVDQAEAKGYLRPGIQVLEYPSPHGGSWVEQLERRSLIEVSQGPAELLVDIFGMMHEADQRAALIRRFSQMSADAILLMQFHTVAAIVRSGFWNALRHGHFAYYSTPVLVRMAAELGLTAIRPGSIRSMAERSCWPWLREGSRWGDPGESVTASDRQRDCRRGSRAHGRSLAERVSRQFGSCTRYLSRGCEVSLRNGGWVQRRISDVGVAPAVATSVPKISSQSPTLRLGSMAEPCQAVASLSCHRLSSWREGQTKYCSSCPTCLTRFARRSRRSSSAVVDGSCWTRCLGRLRQPPLLNEASRPRRPQADDGIPPS